MPLTLGVAASAASESAEGNNLGLVLDVVEEGKSALQLHAVDGLGGLAGVLEADTQVRAPGAGALCGRNILSSVTDLIEEKNPSSAIQSSSQISWFQSKILSFFQRDTGRGNGDGGSRKSGIQGPHRHTARC